MNVQIITHNGTPEYAVIPYSEFEQLLESAEILEDIRTFDYAMNRITSEGEEYFPDSLVERLLSGEHPLKVWREYRGLTLASLAATCSVTTAALSQIEKGKRDPSVALLKRLALALLCDMDDLTPSAP